MTRFTCFEKNVCLLIFISMYVWKRTFYILTEKAYFVQRYQKSFGNLYKMVKKHYNKLKNNLHQFKNILQFVYSNVYSEVYCSTERRGFDLKSTFQIVFKTYKDKKILNKQEIILKIIK